MQGPVGEGQLQQPHQTIEGVVYGHHLAKVGEAKQGSKDGKVAAVQEEAANGPQDQGDNLHRAVLLAQNNCKSTEILLAGRTRRGMVAIANVSMAVAPSAHSL